MIRADWQVVAVVSQFVLGAQQAIVDVIQDARDLLQLLRLDQQSEKRGHLAVWGRILREVCKGSFSRVPEIVHLKIVVFVIGLAN